MCFCLGYNKYFLTFVVQTIFSMSYLRCYVPLIAAVFYLGILNVYGTSADHHIVRKGETLTMIAKQYGVSTQELMRVNKISNPRKLQIGQRLILPKEYSSFKHPSESATISESPAYSSSRASVPPMLRSVIDLLEAPRVRRNRWKYVVVHHSGAATGNARIIDVYHRQKGMENGLAYHFVIGNGRQSKDGQIEVGPRWIRQQPGGHLYDEHLNEVSIGICLVGDFNRAAPSKRQIAAATELIRYLNQRCGGKKLIFRGHREINSRPTDCPGRLFPLRAFHRLFD
jgi:hypothetical protein